MKRPAPRWPESGGAPRRPPKSAALHVPLESPILRFEPGELQNMVAVGSVTAATARVWIRSHRPGRIRLDYWRRGDADSARGVETEIPDDAVADRTTCIALPEGGEPGGLRPAARYDFRVVHESGGAAIGQGSFETAPRDADSAPARFSMALMSCNQPFDNHGRVLAASTDMLAATHAALDEHATKLVFMLGDQMYTDYPPTMSLFEADYFRSVAPRGCESIVDCSAAQVRELLQRRYRCFWNVRGWQWLNAHYPCLPIVDDHELVDNWGSDPEHDTPRWQNFIRGARDAYYDYQGSRVSDDAGAGDFDYRVEYGPAAAYVLDLRSNRRMGDHARIYSPDQFRRLREFLEQSGDREVVLLALSVPAIHLPSWAARAGRPLTLAGNEDFSDRWSTGGHIRDRDRILALLHDHQNRHPHQRLVLLSGDIHIACAHEIAWDDGTRPLLQLVSSGITHRVGRAIQLASKLSIRVKRRLKLDDDGLSADVRLIPPEDSGGLNPYTQLNLGVLEFRRAVAGYAIRYLIYSHRGATPHCVYRSRWM